MEKLTIKLKDMNVDVDSITARLGGNEILYLSICKKFVKDSNFKKFLTAVEENEMNMADVYIHTLKGVAANLGFTRMIALCKDIMHDLKNSDLILLHKKIQELAVEYNRIISILTADEI